MNDFWHYLIWIGIYLFVIRRVKILSLRFMRKSTFMPNNLFLLNTGFVTSSSCDCSFSQLFQSLGNNGRINPGTATWEKDQARMASVEARKRTLLTLFWGHSFPKTWLNHFIYSKNDELFTRSCKVLFRRF